MARSGNQSATGHAARDYLSDRIEERPVADRLHALELRSHLVHARSWRFSGS